VGGYLDHRRENSAVSSGMLRTREKTECSWPSSEISGR
jgi:hypothetical protein